MKKHTLPATLTALLMTTLLTAQKATAAEFQVLQTTLDFSALPEETYAGVHELSLLLKPVETAPLQAQQILVGSESLTEPPLDQPTPKPQVCLTRLKVSGGQYFIKFYDTKYNRVATVMRTLDFTANHRSETEQCPSLESLFTENNQLTFSAILSVDKPIWLMSYQPKAPYKAFETLISVQPYGKQIQLSFSGTENSYVAEKIDRQLAAQILSPNPEGLTYKVYATDRRGLNLTLREGHVELR